MRPNIETHYKDITSHFQKADNIPNYSEPFRTNPNHSEQIRMNLHESTPIYTNLHQYLHEST